MVLNCSRCGETIRGHPAHIKAGTICPLQIFTYGTPRPCPGKLVEEEFPRCLEHICTDQRGFHFRTCGRPGKFAREVANIYQGPKETKHFCKTHDPEAKEARRKARGPTVWERECAARDREARRVKQMEDLLRCITTKAHCTCYSPNGEPPHEDTCLCALAAKALEPPK